MGVVMLRSRALSVWVLVVGLCGCSASKSSSDSQPGSQSPKADEPGESESIEQRNPEPDEAKAPVSPRRAKGYRQQLDLPDSELGDAIATHLENQLIPGPHSAERYNESLTRLRELSQSGHPVAPTVWDAYQRASGSRFLPRWQLVELLEELGSKSAFEPLKTVAEGPLPDRPDSPPGHLETTRRTEAIKIRVRALHGLGALAEVFDSEVARRAEGVLRSTLSKPSKPEQMKLACINELGSLGYNQTELKEFVPEADRDLLDIDSKVPSMSPSLFKTGEDEASPDISDSDVIEPPEE